MLRSTPRVVGRMLAIGLVVAGVAAACSFPPAEPGAPGLVTVDDWVNGRSKIWDLAFPDAGSRRCTPRTTRGSSTPG